MRHYAADIWTESGDRFECLRDVVVQRVRAGEGVVRQSLTRLKVPRSHIPMKRRFGTTP
ncbi:hypothetical protein OAR28_02005 [Amylibacter sp.]|nr:hypothetical protein [Amylibacter sp.]